MVLTNFELWAADGSSASSLPLDFESNTPHTRHLNPFDPRVVPQLNTNFNHLSSNGYYGFSYINAAHVNDNNNNNDNISNNNNDNNNNLNGTAAYNLMANDVNGMNNTVTTTPQQTHASSVNFGSTAYAAGHAVNVTRCKKRYFVINDDDAAAAAAVTNNYEVSAKRCRFDDDFSAQYCNDFFQLPSTQIATQSCLMDIEDAPQQHQQQVDEAMFQNNNNIVKYEHHTTNRQLENVQTLLTAQNHEQQHNNQHSQQQELLQTQQQQQLQPPQQQQNLYHHHHHQQHYQDDIYATIKCHFNNNNHYRDTLTLNHTKRTCQIDSNIIENVFNKSLKLKPKNTKHPKCNENEKFYKNDNQIVANEFKIDDATLFAQLHGGCLHHHHNSSYYCNTNTVSSSGNNNKTNANTYIKDENYYGEF